MKKRSTVSLALVTLLFTVLIYLQTKNGLQLNDILQDTITLSLGVLYEALPFVFLGILLSVLIQLFVKDTWLLRFLPKNQFARRATLSVSGSVLPVCECGNVPLARGLMAKGLKPNDVMTFLLSAPIVNPVTIFTTTQAFAGTPQMAWLRVFGAILVANTVGWLFKHANNSSMLTEDFVAYCNHEHAKSLSNQTPGFVLQIKRISEKFRQETEILLPALIGGSLLAGCIQTLVPRSILTAVSSEPALAILSMIALAFIVSICANVDAFFALSLSGIFPLSAILAFLVFGPMIDLKMLALLRTTFTSRTLVQLTLSVFLLSFIFGMAVHYVI